MTTWKKRHKVPTFLGVLLLLSSCGTVSGDDAKTDDAPAAKPTRAAAVEAAASPSPSPTDEAAVAEPTPQQMWVANYEKASRTSYVAAVAAALALRPKKVDAQSGSLDACRLLGKKRNLDKRVAQVEKSFSLTGAPTYEQSLGALEATTTTICPEFVRLPPSPDRRARQAPADRGTTPQGTRKDAARGSGSARAGSRPGEQEYVYYENCTAVENAGAAPIYAGEPGYSHVSTAMATAWPASSSHSPGLRGVMNAGGARCARHAREGCEPMRMRSERASTTYAVPASRWAMTVSRLCGSAERAEWVRTRRGTETSRPTRTRPASEPDTRGLRDEPSRQRRDCWRP